MHFGKYESWTIGLVGHETWKKNYSIYKSLTDINDEKNPVNYSRLWYKIECLKLI